MDTPKTSEELEEQIARIEQALVDLKSACRTPPFASPQNFHDMREMVDELRSLRYSLHKMRCKGETI
jgi:ribosomal protein L29